MYAEAVESSLCYVKDLSIRDMQFMQLAPSDCKRKARCEALWSDCRWPELASGTCGRHCKKFNLGSFSGAGWTDTGQGRFAWLQQAPSDVKGFPDGPCFPREQN